MVKLADVLVAAADSGLAGNSVRALADKVSNEDSAEMMAAASAHNLEETIRNACGLIRDGLNMAGKSIEQAVDIVSYKAFQSAGDVGTNIASRGTQEMGPHTFSWGGYFQALGVLCLLLAGLWFAVWLVRRYGKFNFLPRPGSLPPDALVMEMQMPLGPRKGLMVVRFLNRRLLLGVTEQRITLLTEEKTQDARLENKFQDYISSAADAGDDSGIDSHSSS